MLFLAHRSRPVASRHALVVALLVMLSPLGLAAGNNWMACLDDSTRLSRITIPGTHDSGARFNVNSFGLELPGTAKCQDFSIAEQLNFGVRYLDIRCRHLADTFPVHHGPVFQELHFNEVLDQVYAFLKDNPTECVLMSVKPEHTTVSPPENNTRTFEETFDSYIADNVDMWWTGDGVPTLDTVRGRIVLVRRFELDPSVTDEDKDRKKGIDATNWPDNTEFQENNLSVQDHYKVDEEDLNEANAIKWDQISRSLAAAAAETNPDILHLNFGSGYRPQLVGLPNIPAVSNYINPRIFTYFADAPPGHYGCVIMDFATAARSELIYSANVSKVVTTGSGDPILAIGDPVLAIDEDIASNSNYPSTEGPGLIVDGSTATKYLNFGNENSGFLVTPAFGQSVLQSFTISTANDAIERDPTSVIIYGTNKVIASFDNSGGVGESWTRIAELDLVLPDARSTPMSVLNVQNDEAFTSYKFVFPKMKGPNNNAMQISEVQFWDRNEGQGTAILQLNDPVLAIHEGTPESSSPDREGPENLFDGNCFTKYLNFGRENSGFIITPAFGPSVAGSFVLTTANDFNGRDPVAWEIFGTNAEIVTEDNGTGQNEPWVSLGAGVIETPETNFTAAPEVFFENRTAYKSYKFLVREIRDPQGEDVNSTQFSEFQLFSVEANSLDGRYDPNDSQVTAFDLTAKEDLPLSILNGTRRLANDDWFEILVDPGEELVSVRCAFQHAEGNIDIALYDFAGNELVRSDSTTNDEEITYQVAGPGSYFIKVYGDEGNSYDLRWNDDDPTSWAQDMWLQVGSDIDGEAAGDYSGRNVSLSSDGSIVAVGAESNDGNGDNSGHVRVYQRNGTEWQQLGSDIDGEAVGDFSGFNISLSSDGSTVAIGAFRNDGNGEDSGHVRVYQWDGTEWQQRGADIDGEAAGDLGGFNVSLNSDGSVIAMGATSNDGNGDSSGHVRVYQWNGNEWQQRGADIDSEAAGDFSGFSISLSADGSVVAIGGTSNDGNGDSSGHVRVYQWNENEWQQRGADIDGEAAEDLSGIVSMSSDGSVVAVGAYGNDGNGDSSGHVRVHQWNGNEWQQRGSDIDGEAAGDFSGFSVSLSANGSTIAIGAAFNDGNGNDSGHVRVYQWSGTEWQQQGSDIDGEAAGDGFGESISLSSDGLTVAVGAPYNDGNGEGSGHVRIFASLLGFDTDGDGLSDFREISFYQTDPLLADTDRDGLDDDAEINIYETNPRKADTNEDGFRDGLAVQFGLNPLTDLGAFREEILEQLSDVRVNSGITSVNDSEAKLRFVIEESDDLSNWNERETIDVTIPLENAEPKKFLRFKVRE